MASIGGAALRIAGAIPVVIAFNDLVLSVATVDGRSMQPTLNPGVTGGAVPPLPPVSPAATDIAPPPPPPPIPTPRRRLREGFAT